MSSANRRYFTVSGTPGTGAITVSTAVAGAWKTMQAGDDGKLFDLTIIEGTAWEVARNCTYTHGTTSFSRGTFEESSTGSAVSFTSAATVFCTESAATMNEYGRLILGGFSAYGDGSSTVSVTAGGVTAVSSAAKTVEFDIDAAFTTSTGIWFPSKSGLYLIGGTAILGSSNSDGATTAIYVDHSTDGSTWTGTEKRALLWRGVQGAANVTVGGSGAYIVSANGTTDRFRMSVFYSGTGSNTVPAAASNRDWIRFWAKYLGRTS